MMAAYYPTKKALKESVGQELHYGDSDPCYLAAKYVVFLAGRYASSPDKPLDFLSVGVVTSAEDMGPECIAYLNCSTGKRPKITF